MTILHFYIYIHNLHNTQTRFFQVLNVRFNFVIHTCFPGFPFFLGYEFFKTNIKTARESSKGNSYFWEFINLLEEEKVSELMATPGWGHISQQISSVLNKCQHKSQEITLSFQQVSFLLGFITLLFKINYYGKDERSHIFHFCTASENNPFNLSHWHTQFRRKKTKITVSHYKNQNFL